MWQLYLEVLFLPLTIPMALAMALSWLIGGYGALALFVLGIAGGLYLMFFHNGLTRKWIEVYRHGLMVGTEYIPWGAVRDIDYTTAVEATMLGSYNIPWRYEEVATVSVLTADGWAITYREEMDGVTLYIVLGLSLGV